MRLYAIFEIGVGYSKFGKIVYVYDWKQVINKKKLYNGRIRPVLGQEGGILLGTAAKTTSTECK